MNFHSIGQFILISSIYLTSNAQNIVKQDEIILNGGKEQTEPKNLLDILKKLKWALQQSIRYSGKRSSERRSNTVGNSINKKPGDVDQ